ncbi:conserved exported hypothetical protein [Mesorhizobium plurifarium]|uniref:DUF1223 domain-containing protein n=1 Tax=Mesorhizobium plurifarium TaxID=69974 RepID=A0A090F8Y3_MESPL|nr:conserved exported hypothetical protein [Mesorhizobium plurifarium]
MAFRGRLRLAAAALALTALGGVALGAEPEKAATGKTDKAQTDRPLGVVELFTSQGCSSCPPADEFFAELAGKDDIVALAYHVNYWDYLGWQDTLSTKENTDRQYDYMRAFGSRSVYTPQAVINGRSHVNGASRKDVDGALARMDRTGEGMRVAIKVSRTSDRVMIDAGDAAGGGPTDAHLVIVYFDPPQMVKIGQGENSGRSLTYWNAVSDIQTAGMWHGKAQRYELPMTEIAKKGGCAVLLQSVGKDGMPGPILGAAFIRKPDRL